VVNQIAFDATTVNNVTTYLVNIYLDSTPSFVRSGISANVFLLVSDRKNVLLIPTDAITPEGDVLVAPGKDQPPQPESVELGQSDGTWTEVISGLNEGDWIARPVFNVEQAHKGGFSFISNIPKHR
jgi:macrolide-specific efflux system membrane fusion protein